MICIYICVCVYTHTRMWMRIHTCRHSWTLPKMERKRPSLPVEGNNNQLLGLSERATARPGRMPFQQEGARLFISYRIRHLWVWVVKDHAETCWSTGIFKTRWMEVLHLIKAYKGHMLWVFSTVFPHSPKNRVGIAAPDPANQVARGAVPTALFAGFGIRASANHLEEKAGDSTWLLHQERRRFTTNQPLWIRIIM